jgi:holliday junction DNA helicase RuvA
VVSRRRDAERGDVVIVSVRGEVLDVALDHVVIEAAGVGYRLNAAPITLSTLVRGEQARLFATLVVREDSHTLYGFADVESRELFGLLQTVAGVGAKLALAVLSVLEPEALRKALAEGNLVALTRVPGIGKRVAERMIVDLRDKVDAVATSPETPRAAVSAAPVRDEVVQALSGLGFQAKPAEKAVDAVLAAQPDAGNAAVLRAALAELGKK